MNFLKNKKRISLSLSLITLASVHIVASCAIGPRKREPIPASPDAKKMLEQVEVDMASGNSKKALQRIEAIVKQYPDSDIADDALMAQGNYYFKKGEFNKAYDSFMGVANSEFFSPNEGDALYMAASSLQKMGRLDEALGLLKKGIQIDGLSRSLTLRMYKLSYGVQGQLGDKLGSLYSLIQMSELEDIEPLKKSHLIRAVELVETRLIEEELESVADDSKFKLVQPYALYKTGIIKFEQRDFRRARDHFNDVATMLPNSDLAEKALQRIEQIDARRTVDKKTIGAVLPLTGKHSNVAYRTLQGIQLGLGIYGNNTSDFKLAVIDSEGNPDTARRGVERLVTEDHVIGIIGSLLSKTSVAVASKADELGVPSIALSQKAGLTEIGQNVFRNSLTSAMQVHHLVRTAMEELKMKRFAILYPNDAYGVEYTNLFWDAVLARGGEIVAVQAYKPKTTNFSDPIRRLVGTYYIEDRRAEYKERLKKWFEGRKTLRGRQSPPEDILPPVVSFDALFVPDSVTAMGQIAPTLAYHDISGVKLLGTNLWNTSSLVRLGQKYVDDAVFVDSLLQSDEKFRSSHFFKEFKAVFGAEPGLFEAQAYDAALILRQAIASGESSRVGLAQRLSRKQSFSGATGNLKMSDQREILRPLVTLTVHKNQITRLDDYPLNELFPEKTPPEKKKSTN
ncbi:MAG: penicillin-binding protein activator [Bdellovibrionales bacterium]|nr:penicillin-binding protein activator [Bdellovibrionales bacterium]